MYILRPVVWIMHTLFTCPDCGAFPIVGGAGHHRKADLLSQPLSDVGTTICHIHCRWRWHCTWIDHNFYQKLKKRKLHDYLYDKKIGYVLQKIEVCYPTCNTMYLLHPKWWINWNKNGMSSTGTCICKLILRPLQYIHVF